MLVNVQFKGRLGNNLFQYALGRIIAEHHGWELICENPGGEKWGDNVPTATLDSLSANFPNAPLHIAASPQHSSNYHSNQNVCFLQSNILDLKFILDDRTPRTIILSGFFQRIEYYEPYRKHIQEWFKPAVPGISIKPSPSDVLISVRRGQDYNELNWMLDISYYLAALARMRDISKVYVCGIGIDDYIREGLSDWDIAEFSAPPAEQFAFSRSFNRIVLSNSTFAWWAAYLSEAQEIYAPGQSSSGQYNFHNYGTIDLRMKDPRYHEIDID